MKGTKMKFTGKLLVLMLLLLCAASVSVIGYAAEQYTENLIPQMTSNTTPSGIASASDTHSVAPPFRAFNRSTDYSNDRWGSNSGITSAWLSYEFDTVKTITKYTLIARSGTGLNSAPKNWTFEGSNDGTNWIILDTRSEEINWESGEKREYTFTNNSQYKIYRINMTANNGATYYSIAEMEMMETVSTVTEAPTNLTATEGSAGADLAWDAVTGAEGYNVKRAITSGGPYTTVAEAVYTTTYTDTNVTGGTTYYYVVTAVNGSGESENSNEASVQISTPSLNLDIEAADYQIDGGAIFTADIVINNANNIYAEDLYIQYDTTLFEYIEAGPVDPTALEIYYKEDTTPGTARYIVASKGATNGLNGKQQILRLTFKAKNVDGAGQINVSTGLVADGDGNEFEALCSGKTFTVTKQNLGDVNHDGRFSLGDLAIAGHLFGSDVAGWGTYEPDVDANGNVENTDLTTIVQAILAN
ncbi:MAG: cohesin domain-containing protein [Bacillota bacterium]